MQQDPHYRLDCTTRGYYQHPNTSFYLGVGMPMPPLPPVFQADLRWKGGSWSSGFTTFDMNTAATYADSKSLIFDVSGDNTVPITLSASASPSAVYVMNPRGHDYIFQGDGSLTGSITLIKSMLGTATFNTNLAYTGKTIISEGTLVVNGTVNGPVELRAKGTLSGQAVLNGGITFEGALNYEGCRLMPVGTDGIITFNQDLTLSGNVYLEIEAAQGKSGRLQVNGNLTISGQNTITVNQQQLAGGQYVLATCTGTLTADVTKLKSRGLEGINYDFVVDNNRLLMVVHDTRDASEGVTWTGTENNLWDYKSENFNVDGGSTTFVTGDAVIFGETSSSTTITVDDMMPTNGVTFNGGTYTFTGEGGISGTGDITVNGGADVTFNLKNSDYTGKTIVNKGSTLTVPNFYDGTQKSALGAATAQEGNLQLHGGTLVLSKDNMGTDRVITLTDTATIRIAQSNSALSLKGKVTGTGYLIKDGAGQLNFTYGGANPFAGIIVKRGIIAQGAWNSTFGRVGTPMVLAGGEVHQIDVNSTSTVPELNHVVTVVEGTTNKIIGSSRGKINGSFKGAGNLTIETRYVRCDVGANFSAFEGTLTAVGSQFRLMQSVTDMSKTHFVVSPGAYIAHFASGGGSEVTATTKIGSLSSPLAATDGVLGGSNSTYQIGFLNENTNYYGLLKAASIVKVGTGKLTLRTPGHTSPITVNGGTLELYNSSTTAMTTSAITVGKGGTLSGNGLASTVNVNAGGSIAAGVVANVAGTLRITNLNLRQGATTRCVLTGSSNSKFKVTGRITHAGDTLLIVVPATRTLSVGDEIEVYPAGFTSASGDVIVKCESDGMTYAFDVSTLNTDGKVRVTEAEASGISNIITDDVLVDVYTTDGIKLRTQTVKAQALDGLPQGVYILQTPRARQKVAKW